MEYIRARTAALGLAALLSTIMGSAAYAASPAAPAPDAPATTGGERANIIATGSTLITPFTEAIMARLQTAAGLPAPEIRAVGTSKGVADFCAGTGIGTPDIVAMSRRMRYAEFEGCKKNGVSEILEIQLGYEALVVVVRKDDDLSLSLSELYHGLAKELPSDSEFLPNHNNTWKDVNAKLPETRISAILPSRALGARGFFNDRILQGACRGIFEINSIYEAEDRVDQCIGLRNDGRIKEVGLPLVDSMREAFQTAKPGTIGVMSLRHAQELSDTVKVIAFEGVVASREAIADRSYEFVRPLYYYVKRAHVKDYTGAGPVAGLREFITEVTRDSAIGAEGYLIPLGLVPMDEDRREDVREAALHLHPLVR
ncbi:MAG: PstS family phosphate ABC transporter substrate-binding protein [Alphaproteobacteria bacterium]